MNRTDRLYALVEELRAVAPRVRSVRWLAQRFEVSARTIERDLSALQQSGVPIWATTGRRGGYALDPRMTLPPLNFSPAEAAAIAVALAASGSAPFSRAAHQALRKLTAAMSPSGRQGARELTGRIRVVPTAAEPLGPVAGEVERAFTDRRVLQIEYADQDGTTTCRHVEPVGLTGLGRRWYLLAWCRLRGGHRAFRLDRITSATVTDEAATPRPLPELDCDLPIRFLPLSIDG
ncbi:MAG TPA: WYL domain-containing protein [Pseudonocardiaceae bacterium]